MKLERSNIEFPIWRKKVDSSLLQHSGTTIPNWACKMWDISSIYSQSVSRKDPSSRTRIIFERMEYPGWVTIATRGRKTPAYRLWFSDEIQYMLKQVFQMTYMRDIESRLRKKTSE